MAKVLVPLAVSVGSTIEPFSARFLTKHWMVMWVWLTDDAVTPSSVAVGGLSLESFFNLCVCVCVCVHYTCVKCHDQVGGRWCDLGLQESLIMSGAPANIL